MYSGGDAYYKQLWYYGTMLAFRCSSNSKMPEQADVQRYGMGRFILWLDSIYACPSGMVFYSCVYQ